MNSNNLLITFDNNYIPYPFGLHNNGVICYFNSLIQSLLSCSSFNQYLLINEEMFKSNDNKLAILLIDTIKKNLVKNNLPKNVEMVSVSILRQLILIHKKKNPKFIFGGGQEDVHECLVLLLEALDDKNLDKLFLHKYRCDIYCKECKELKKIPNDYSFHFEIPMGSTENYELEHLYKDKKPEIKLEKFIRNNISNISHLRCEKCENTNLLKVNRLTFIPTIMLINLNKYKQKELFKFPLTLNYINGKRKKKYMYKLVSIIEHSGGQRGGHYIALSNRKENKNNVIDEKKYIFNDISFKQIEEFKPTLNSYNLFYHFIGDVDI